MPRRLSADSVCFGAFCCSRSFTLYELPRFVSTCSTPGVLGGVRSRGSGVALTLEEDAIERVTASQRLMRTFSERLNETAKNRKF